MSNAPLIIYYSRDGHSEKLAEDLATNMGAELCQITTHKYAPSVFGWLAAGRDALLGRSPKVSGLDELPPEDRLIVLVGPVWAGRPAAPLNTVIRMLKPTKHRVAMALTCGDPKAKEAPLDMAEKMLGRAFVSRSVLCSATENWLLDSDHRRRFALDCNIGLEWQG